MGRVTGAQGWCGGAGLQVAVDQGDGGGSFADRGGDPFDRSLADVAGGEYPGQAGLQRQRRAAGGPAGVGGQVRAGEDEPPPVADDGVAEPVRPGLSADQDEQGVGRDSAGGPGGGIG